MRGSIAPFLAVLASILAVGSHANYEDLPDGLRHVWRLESNEGENDCVDLTDTNPAGGAVTYCEGKKQMDGSSQKVCNTYSIKSVTSHALADGEGSWYFVKFGDSDKCMVLKEQSGSADSTEMSYWAALESNSETCMQWNEMTDLPSDTLMLLSDGNCEDSGLSNELPNALIGSAWKLITEGDNQCDASLDLSQFGSMENVIEYCPNGHQGKPQDEEKENACSNYHAKNVHSREVSDGTLHIVQFIQSSKCLVIKESSVTEHEMSYQSALIEDPDKCDQLVGDSAVSEMSLKRMQEGTCKHSRDKNQLPDTLIGLTWKLETGEGEDDCVDLTDANPFNGEITYCGLEKQSDGSSNRVCNTYSIKWIDSHSLANGEGSWHLVQFEDSDKCMVFSGQSSSAGSTEMSYSAALESDSGKCMQWNDMTERPETLLLPLTKGECEDSGSKNQLPNVLSGSTWKLIAEGDNQCHASLDLSQFGSEKNFIEYCSYGYEEQPQDEKNENACNSYPAKYWLSREASDGTLHFLQLMQSPKCLVIKEPSVSQTEKSYYSALIDDPEKCGKLASDGEVAGMSLKRMEEGNCKDSAPKQQLPKRLIASIWKLQPDHPKKQCVGSLDLREAGQVDEPTIRYCHSMEKDGNTAWGCNTYSINSVDSRTRSDGTGTWYLLQFADSEKCLVLNQKGNVNSEVGKFYEAALETNEEKCDNWRDISELPNDLSLMELQKGKCKGAFDDGLPASLIGEWSLNDDQGCTTVDLTAARQGSVTYCPIAEQESCVTLSINSTRSVTVNNLDIHVLVFGDKCLYFQGAAKGTRLMDCIEDMNEVNKFEMFSKAIKLTEGPCKMEPEFTSTPSPPGSGIIPSPLRKKWTREVEDETKQTCEVLDLSKYPEEVYACGPSTMRLGGADKECMEYSIETSKKVRFGGDEDWYQLELFKGAVEPQQFNAPVCLYIKEAKNEMLLTTGITYCRTLLRLEPTDSFEMRDDACNVEPKPSSPAFPMPIDIPDMIKTQWYRPWDDNEGCTSLDLSHLPHKVVYTTFDDDKDVKEHYRPVDIEHLGNKAFKITLHRTSSVAEEEAKEKCLYLAIGDNSVLEGAIGSCDEGLEKQADSMYQGLCRQRFRWTLPPRMKTHWKLDKKDADGAQCESIDFTYVPKVVTHCQFGPEKGKTESACDSYSVESVEAMTVKSTKWYLLKVAKRGGSAEEACIYVLDSSQGPQTSGVVSCGEDGDQSVPESVMPMDEGYCPVETPLPSPRPGEDKSSMAKLPLEILQNWHTGKGKNCKSFDFSGLPSKFRTCTGNPKDKECQLYSLTWVNQRSSQWYEMQLLTTSFHQKCLLVEAREEATLGTTPIRDCPYEGEKADQEVEVLLPGPCDTSVSATPSPKVSPSSSPLPAPEIRSVSLDRFGTTLTILFDTQTNRGGLNYREKFNCLHLLEWSEDKELNPFRFCIWKEKGSALDVALEPSDADVFNDVEVLGPGSTLVLKGGMIQQIDGSHSMPSREISVPNPSPKPQVQFAVDYQKFVTVCRGIRITTLYSQGSGRQGNLDWSWTLSEGLEQSSKSKALIEKLDEASKKDREMITLGKEHLTPGSEYNITLKASNQFGSSQTREIKFWTVDDRDLSLEVTDGSEGERPASEDVMFGVRSSVSDCGKTNMASAAMFAFNFTWDIVYPDGEVHDVQKFVTRDPRKLRIPAGELSPDPDPYTIRVMVKASKEEGVQRELGPVVRKFSVQINPAGVNANIEGGDRSAGVNNSLVLDASESKSPYHNSDEQSKWTSTYRFSWMCRFPDEDTYDGDCSKLLEAQKDSVLDIPPTTLRKMQAATDKDSPEIEFKVKVEYTVESSTRKFNFEDSDKVFITLLQESPPNVRFVGIGPNNFIVTTTDKDDRKAFLVNSFDEIRMDAEAQTSSPDSVLGMQWEVLNGDLDLEAEDGQPNEEVIVGAIDSQTLRIRPGSLSPGTHYALRFKSYFVGNEDNYGFTDVHVVVNTPPRGGTINVQPVTEGKNISSPVVSVDELIVEASGWSDENPPFSYRFSYTYGEDLSTTLSWTSFGRRRSFQTKLPLPEGAQPSKMRIVCEIKDSLGALTKYHVPLDNLAYPSSDQFKQIAEDKLKEAEECVATKAAECALLALRDRVNAGQMSEASRMRSLLFAFGDETITQLNKLLDFVSLDDVPSFVDTVLSHVKALQSDKQTMKELVNTMESLLSWLLAEEPQSLDEVSNVAERVLAGISHMLNQALDTDEVDAAVEKLLELVYKSELDFSNFISIQPPFPLYRAYCKNKQNLGIALQNAQSGTTQVIEPSQRHGFGLSDKEYESCNQSPKDTSGDDRVLPRASLQIPDNYNDLILVLKEFAKVPSAKVPEGISFSDLTRRSNKTEEAYSSLIQQIASLIPGGNTLSRSDFHLEGDTETDSSSTNSRRELVQSGMFASDVVGTVESDLVQDAAVKTVETKVYSGSSLENTLQADGDIDLPVYPSNQVDLQKAVNILDILSDKNQYPYTDVTCKGESLKFECPIPGVETREYTLKCGSGFENTTIRMFCPTKVVLPTALRMESGEWTDQGVSVKSFNGRKLALSTKDVGMHSAILHSIDVSPFGRVIKVPKLQSMPAGVQDPAVVAKLPLVLNSLADFSADSVRSSISETICNAVGAHQKACSVLRDYMEDVPSSSQSRILSDEQIVNVEVVIRTYMNGDPTIDDTSEENVTEVVKSRLQNNKGYIYSEIDNDDSEPLDVNIAASKDRSIEIVFEKSQFQGGNAEQSGNGDDESGSGSDASSSESSDGDSQVLIVTSGVVGGVAVVGLVLVALIVVFRAKRKKEQRAGSEQGRKETNTLRSTRTDPEACDFSSVENPLSSTRGTTNPQHYLRNNDTQQTKNAFEPTRVRGKV